MKIKTATIIISMLFAGSTISTSAQSLSTVKDSVAYSVGLSMAEMVKGFDSTLNIDLTIQGFKDAFANRPKIEPDDLQRIIRDYYELKAAEETKVRKELAAKQMDSIATFQGIKRTKSGLLYSIEKLGYKRHPKEGDQLTVQYEMYDVNGNLLDSSYEREAPIEFENKDGQMIAGFLEGVRLLREGGKSTIYVPPHLGYGENRSADLVKPYQVLVFKIELVKIGSEKKKEKAVADDEEYG